MCRGRGSAAAAGAGGGSACGVGAWERRLRPPPPPEGKGSRRPARSQPDPAASAAGAAGRGRGSTGRAARARRQRGHVRGPSSRAGLPRAALSIHKFSACSAATGRRSQPGEPRSRPPPARRPWAARPGAEGSPPQFRMQPTATMATTAAAATTTTTTTNTATVALTTSWDNATGRPTAEPDPILDNYVLLVVVMSLFVGGTLVVLSGVLLLCKRCWDVHQRLNRAMEEVEKTTTTYLDNGTHPAQDWAQLDSDSSLFPYRPGVDPDFRGEDPESQDAETERFLSTSSTGRRVSFNEAALFEQSRKTQDKGRRYTLTEGDFHHLKNARLTHLHLPPLKIVTIHECDSGEASSAATPHPATSPKATLAIFQPPGKALTGRSVGPSSALPGDPYNSAAGATDFAEISPSASSDSGEGISLDASTRSTKAGGPGAAAGPGEVGPGSGTGTVLQFLTRLRRHASLDGASPYFKVKKWKLEPSQRAASLDTRGSPKRHHFQRQRAASESTEQEEGGAPHEDFIQYIARAGDAVAFPRPRPFLASPPPALGRYFSVDGGARGGPVGPCPASPPPLGGPGSALQAPWTRAHPPPAARPLPEADSLGPPLQHGPEEGSREKLG
ncbi:voltage-dependent calcium channel beta subunit-associated regulatory protein-like [Trachypithecus francoisi]|uniref:voltage-dependent calcium channel beta subunit-associated regulatory protein-like n=1 Tax=Trachypithecus francoisi TaxID=54180 RepID=UPI00141BDB25|nr:voltage-dependent calcium channel beta subunit-associated regulatory protein-like [Trachypithecus francoisi]